MTFTGAIAEDTGVACPQCVERTVVFQNGSYRCAGLATLDCTWVLPYSGWRQPGSANAKMALACYEGLLMARGLEPNHTYLSMLRREAEPNE